jgi:hypothetical protein
MQAQSPLIYNVRVRLALFMLLFANLAFLAWSQWVDVPGPTAPVDSTARLPRLKLAAEAPAAPVARAAEAEPKQPGATAQCVSVGPFDDAGSASRGVDVLRKSGFASRQRSEAGIAPLGWWAGVVGLTSDDEVKRDLQKLTANGILEATALQLNSDEWRISTGLFTGHDKARLRLQTLLRLGFKAEINQRKLPPTLYWLDVTVTPGQGAVPAQDLYKGPPQRFGALPCPEGGPPAATDETPKPPAERRSPRVSPGDMAAVKPL